VWSLTGLWHGANFTFILWGLLFFVLIAMEKYTGFEKRGGRALKVGKWLYTMLFVLLGWVLFRFTEPKLILMLAKSLFGLNGNPLSAFTDEIQLQSHMFLLAAAVFACTPAMKLLKARLEGFVSGKGALKTVWNIVFYSLLPVILLLLSTACLVGDSYNPFIYFQF
jgi:alginate O-acetyltransferase complex protein AlgI